MTVDTNVLVRAAVSDQPDQSRAARALLHDADLVALTLPCLCEFVWVLRSVYRVPDDDVVAAITTLIAAGNVVVDRQAVDAGLSFLERGGDFADGVIVHQGFWLGADTFVSFDKQAVELIKQRGGAARLLS